MFNLTPGTQIKAKICIWLSRLLKYKLKYKNENGNIFIKSKSSYTITCYECAKPPWCHNIESLFFCLFALLSFCLFVFLPFCLFVSFFFVFLGFCLFVFLYFCHSVILSLCLSVFLSVCFSFCLFVILSFCLFFFFCLLLYLFLVCLSDITLIICLKRTSSLKTHSLCWKVAVTHWVTDRPRSCM